MSCVTSAPWAQPSSRWVSIGSLCSPFPSIAAMHAHTQKSQQVVGEMFCDEVAVAAQGAPSEEGRMNLPPQALAASVADWQTPPIGVTDYNAATGCVDLLRPAFGGRRRRVTRGEPLHRYPPESLKRKALSAFFDTISLVDDMLLDILNGEGEMEQDDIDFHKRKHLPFETIASSVMSLPRGLRKDPNPALIRQWAQRCGIPTQAKREENPSAISTANTRGRDGVIVPQDCPSAPVDLSYMAVIQAPLRSSPTPVPPSSTSGQSNQGDQPSSHPTPNLTYGSFNTSLQGGQEPTEPSQERTQGDFYDARGETDIVMLRKIVEAVREESRQATAQGSASTHVCNVFNLSNSRLPQFYQMEYHRDNNFQSQRKADLFLGIKAQTRAGPSSILFELDPVINFQEKTDPSEVSEQQRGRKSVKKKQDKMDDVIVTELIADDCELNDDDLALLAHWIKEGHTGLTKISLCNNYFTSYGADLIKKSLKYNPNILQVNLDHNFGITTVRGQPNKEGLEILQKINQRLKNHQQGKNNATIMMKLRGRSRSVPKRATS